MNGDGGLTSEKGENIRLERCKTAWFWRTEEESAIDRGPRHQGITKDRTNAKFCCESAAQRETLIRTDIIGKDRLSTAQCVADDALFREAYIIYRHPPQCGLVEARFGFQAKVPFALIIGYNGRRNVQGFSNANHNLIKNSSEVHCRGKSTGNIFERLALTILDFRASTNLGAVDGSRQHMHNGVDQSS